MNLKSEFYNSKLESIEKGSYEWISNLEGLKIQMNEFSLTGSVSIKDFMIYVLKNLTKEYDIILDRPEKHLTSSGDDALTFEVIQEKLN